ncbi:MAG: hypothetical protein GTO54_02695, partial [Nitrososphaeria archaeon]|nr:hypothetical protein [Nitrososphaeria archaeon]
SEKIGVDVRVTHGALKGPNNKLFTKAFNVSKGRNVLVSPDVIARSVVAFPGEMNKKSGKIKAMVGGQIQKVP